MRPALQQAEKILYLFFFCLCGGVKVKRELVDIGSERCEGGRNVESVAGAWK